MNQRTRPKILLVGAEGQLGFELLRSLRNVGDVHGTTYLPTSDPAAAVLPKLDLTDRAKVREAMQALSPDVVINAAAYTAVDKAEQERELAHRINATAVEILANEAAAVGSAIIHYSTDYVFSGEGENSWVEDDRPNPVNYYGETKLAGELAIRGSGAPHVILRISWLYGIVGQNFVKTMLRLAAERETINVVNDQIGAPTAARNVADATAQILCLAKGRIAAFFKERGGLYHLCSSGHTNWHAFAEEIFRIAREMKRPLAVKTVNAIATSDYPTPAKRPRNSRMNCNWCARQFGIVMPDWSTALADTMYLLNREFPSATP